MYYNLKDFGKEVLNIRNNLQLTQKNVSEYSHIHVDTLRKIENAKVIPTQETLDLLSPILKTDLNQLLLNHRLNNYYTFEEIKNRLELKVDKDEYQTLSVELNDLKTLLRTESNTYFIDLIKQLKLLIESIILNKKHKKENEALNKLIDAINITTPTFSLNNYEEFVYNSMELRILMNIGLLINKTESTEKSLRILKFSFKMLESNEELYPKLCYNLSYTYHRLGVYEDALRYSKLGIKHCENFRNYNGLNHLYFRKGIAEYLLDHKVYINSLKKSLHLCEMFGQYQLKNMIISNCKKLYNIEL